MEDDYPDGLAGGTAKEPADAFMDVVERAAGQIPPELYPRRAFICLNKEAFPRKQCIQLVEWAWFEKIVLTLIFLNFITMLLFSDPLMLKMYTADAPRAQNISDYAGARAPFDDWHKTMAKAVMQPADDCELGRFPFCSAGEGIDFVFLVAFTFEMTVKLLAHGVIFHSRAYFRIGWNWLDAIVVVTGWINMAGAGQGTNALRLFKALRPLRSMQRIRGMRVIVSCILAALPQLCTVVVFLMFVLSIFGIVGVQLFKGSLRHQCWLVKDAATNFTTYLPQDSWESTGAVCAAYCPRDSYTGEPTGVCDSLGENTTTVEGTSGLSKKRPGQWIWTCNPGEECRCGNTGWDDPNCYFTDNPNYGINHFDNVLWAMVSLFQAISLEGWVDIMYTVMDGSGLFAFVYFIVVIVLGALIIINLFLAVLCDNFNMADSDPENGAPDQSDAEKETIKAMQALTQTNPIRAACLWICKQAWFNHVIFGCICLNTILMMSYVRPQPGMDQEVRREWRDYDYLDPGLYWTLWSLNATLTFIFVCESIIKLLGLGFNIFVKDSFNVFDVCVVVVSLVELSLDIVTFTVSSFGSAVPGLSVLRAFRIFRLLKLVRSVPSLRKILSTLINSIKQVFYLFLLLVLIMVIFALLGMDLFGGFYPRPEFNYTLEQMPFVWSDPSFNGTVVNPDGYNMTWVQSGNPMTRYNFDSFGDAFLSIFVVLSGENWNEIYFDQHRATWDEQGWFATVYFIILFVVGNLLLFNLFIAILLSNMDDTDEEEEEEEDDDLVDEPEPLHDGDAASIGLPPSSRKVGGGPAGKESPMISYGFGQYRSEREHDEFKRNTRSSSVDAKGGEGATNGASPGAPGDASLRDSQSDVPLPAMPKPDEPSGDRSLMLFPWSSPFRRNCAALVAHPYFDPVVIVLIITSSFSLALNWPGYDENEPRARAFKVLDYVFTTLFTIEMLLKVVSMGFIYSKNKAYPAYMRSGWNVLDFVVVLISLLTLTPVDIAIFNVLRALRALRPLRLVSRNEDLKVCVSTLLRSIPAMSVLMTVAGLFFIIFGILGIELFGGKFGSCLMPDRDFSDGLAPAAVWPSGVVPGIKGSSTNFQSDFEECMAYPKYNLSRHTTLGIPLEVLANENKEWLKYIEFPQWVNPHFGHFDDIIYALILLFEVAALEGWPDVMFRAMDSDMNEMYVEPWMFDQKIDPRHLIDPADGEQHKHTPNNWFGAIYFITWIILGCFVVMNMTIGVVVDTFSKIREENDGCALMTMDQGEWVKAQKQVFAMRPLRQAVPPKQKWRLQFFELVTSNKFDVFIMGVIFFNMMCMGLDMHAPGRDVTGLNDFIFYSNLVFTTTYLIEAIVKLIAFGAKQYFKDGWNTFDFILVALSLFDLTLGLISFAEDGEPSSSELPVPAPLIRVLRLFRVVRILRIIKTAKKLRAIIMTVVISIPALYNIGLLTLLLLFIYSVLCMELFAYIYYTPGNWGETYGGGTQAMNGIAFKYNTDYFYSGVTNYGDYINRHANFENFGMAMLTLARCVTGESFNGIMHDVMGGDWADNRLRCCPRCGPVIDGKEESSCGDTFMALLVFISFQIIMAYIVISLCVGVILENFANVGSETKKITMEQLEEFREVWLKYDPTGTFIVPSHNLLAILQSIRKPLGIAGMEPALTRSGMLMILGELDIPDHGGYIHFMETLTALAYNSGAGTAVPLNETTKKMQRAMQKVPMLSRLEKPAHNALTNYLVSLLQSRWRGYAMRKKYSGEQGFDENMPELAADVPQPMPPGDGSGSKVKGNQVAPEP